MTGAGRLSLLVVAAAALRLACHLRAASTWIPSKEVPADRHPRNDMAGPPTAGPPTIGNYTIDAVAGPTTAGPTTAGPITAEPYLSGPIPVPPTTKLHDANDTIDATDRPTSAGATTAGPTTAESFPSSPIPVPPTTTTRWQGINGMQLHDGNDTIDAVMDASSAHKAGSNGDGTMRLKSRNETAFLGNRARLMAAPGCHGVLLTSQGGVASSAFMAAVDRVQARGSSSFYTNDRKDRDGFKHLPASRWTGHDAGALRGKANHALRGKSGGDEHCFGKAIVVVGDPVHTIESTHRRYGMTHINKLRRGSGRKKKYPRRMPVERLYESMAAAGKDATGLVRFVTEWYKASRDRDHWPDIRVVTARILMDCAADHARWIGVVEEGDMQEFRSMAFDTSKQHKAAPTVSSTGTAEKVMEVFAEVTDIVNAIDKLPCDGKGAAL